MARAQASSAAPPAATSKRVCVIGAGAAGLAAARELRVEGHTVTVIEQGPGVGGVWAYEPETDLTAGRAVHSSMYASLRTNLPRELMGYAAMPFAAGAFEGSRDARRFPGHAEVLAYLQAFARSEGVEPLIRFGTAVRAVRPAGGGWAVSSSPSHSTTGDRERREEYDAVVVANGHYSSPRVPGGIEGANSFKGELLHSHNYRSPKDFEGKRVVVLGAMASGEDIAREIASCASAVYLSARTWQNPAWADDPSGFGERRNVWRRRNLEALGKDGSARFEGGAMEHDVDAVVFCTGYVYDFPFLDAEECGVAVEDNCVAPLWEHLLPPQHGATLSFVGLPWKVVPFPQFELQARLVARALSGRAALPSAAEMAAEAAAGAAEADRRGPRRHAHQLGDAQFAYNDRLAGLCGCDALPGWRAEMYWATGRNKRARPEQYRDVHDDAGPLQEAEEEFRAVQAAAGAGEPAAARL